MYFPVKSNKSILALGTEYDTRLAYYNKGDIIFSQNTNNLADNPNQLEEFILAFSEKEKIKPDVIITDLHPLYSSRKIGQRLAKKWNIGHIGVQHHIAHIFSAVGDYMISQQSSPQDCCGAKIQDTRYKIHNTNLYGIVCDGTGYGLDGAIWGGEVFKMKISREFRVCNVERIGHLQQHYLIGGELAVREPARMVISILKEITLKENVFEYVKKYYSENEFELLYNQVKQNFNCTPSSSTARVFDAVSLLLGFCENERKYKHYPIKMMEKEIMKNSGKCCILEPKVRKNNIGKYVLNTAHLFKYLIDNIENDKNKLAYIAQEYIIRGLYEIIKIAEGGDCLRRIFFSGGLAENKVMRDYAVKNNIYVSKNIPSGDSGIAFGQIAYYLMKE